MWNTSAWQTLSNSMFHLFGSNKTSKVDFNPWTTLFWNNQNDLRDLSVKTPLIAYASKEIICKQKTLSEGKDEITESWVLCWWGRKQQLTQFYREQWSYTKQGRLSQSSEPHTTQSLKVHFRFSNIK